MAASAASFLATFSVIEDCIFSIWACVSAAGAAAGVASGVAVTVVAGVTVTAGGVDAGVAAGSGVTMTAGAVAGGAVGSMAMGAGLGATVWASMGRHSRDSATMDSRLGRFMVVLLGGALDDWWGVPPESSGREGPGWDWIVWEHTPTFSADSGKSRMLG